MKPNPGPAPAPDAAPINILIVDDEPGNLVVLETLLDDPGYRLARAESGEQALLALLADDFALLILDIGMPGMSGLELAQIIKRRVRNAATPIIFLTAYYHDDEHILEGYGSGAVDYLHKPVNAAILRSKVAVFAELHRKNLALLSEVRRRRHAEEELRALSQRVVQVQETERGYLALELHDHVTQLVCAAQIRSHVLMGMLPGRDSGPKGDAAKLSAMLGQVAAEVERISQSLRPSVLEHLGLTDALRACGTTFAARTGVVVVLDVVELGQRLPVVAELALFRIIQDALRNVEDHADAQQVTMALKQEGGFVRLTIKDDGVGFDPAVPQVAGGEIAGLGLLGMRERAKIVSATFTVQSAPHAGTEIEVLVPFTAGKDAK